MKRPYLVHAEWDEDAGVWVATSEDVPGLVTESATIEDLDAKLSQLVLDLLTVNHSMPADGQVSVELLARRISQCHTPAA